MQSIVNVAVDAGHFPKISASYIVAGIHADHPLSLSLGDALSPFRNGIPTEIIQSARNAFYGKSGIMSGRELKRFAKELYQTGIVGTTDVERFPELLLRAGVIGFVLDLPSDLYHKARFEYLMPDTLPLRDDLTYCVHPVMGDLFKMKGPDDGKAIYPLSELDSWLETAAKI